MSPLTQPLPMPFLNSSNLIVGAVLLISKKGYIVHCVNSALTLRGNQKNGLYNYPEGWQEVGILKKRNMGPEFDSGPIFYVKAALGVNQGYSVFLSLLVIFLLRCSFPLCQLAGQLQIR